MRHVHRLGPLLAHGAPRTAPSQPSGRAYVEVREGGITACLSVEPTGPVVFAEGLLWCDGRVLEQFSQAIHLQGRPVEEAIRATIARWSRRQRL